MDKQYIGISEHRINHMLGVARKCYYLAKEKYNMTEEDARKMFFMGLIHDFGYEFSECPSEHPIIAGDILNSMTIDDFCNIVDAIKHHGKIEKYEYQTADYILNEADLTINSQGAEVTMEERIEDIKGRYGEISRQYRNACKLKQELENRKG